jgi:hypothetical protein
LPFAGRRLSSCDLTHSVKSLVEKEKCKQ